MGLDTILYGKGKATPVLSTREKTQMQNVAVEPSSIEFPRAIYAVVGGKSVETVCDDPKAYDAFYQTHIAGKNVQVLNVRRLTNYS